MEERKGIWLRSEKMKAKLKKKKRKKEAKWLVSEKIIKVKTFKGKKREEND